MSPKPQLIIPVENQVRELDPKLLLATVAANRGFTAVIGFRRELHFHIARFQGGIYLSKSMTDASDSMFTIMRKLGCQVAAWDEEALVHLPPDIYYSRRLSQVADDPGVPLHLRNAPTSLMKDFGYGAGYQYAHDFEGQTAPIDEGLKARLRRRSS